MSSSHPLSWGGEALLSQASGQLAFPESASCPQSSEEHGAVNTSPQGLAYHMDMALWFL